MGCRKALTFSFGSSEVHSKWFRINPLTCFACEDLKGLPPLNSPCFFFSARKALQLDPFPTFGPHRLTISRRPHKPLVANLPFSKRGLLPGPSPLELRKHSDSYFFFKASTPLRKGFCSPKPSPFPLLWSFPSVQPD